VTGICRIGVRCLRLFRCISLRERLVNLLSQFGGEVDEFLNGDAREGAFGQFVFDIFLEAKQPVQILFARGGDFFVQKFPPGGAEGVDVGSELAAPIDQGAFGEVEFGSDVSEAPALGAEFDEFVLFINGEHRGLGLGLGLWSVGVLRGDRRWEMEDRRLLFRLASISVH